MDILLKTSLILLEVYEVMTVACLKREFHQVSEVHSTFSPLNVTMTTGDIIQCARECFNMGSQCSSFSYNDPDSECSLGSCITPSFNVTDILTPRYSSAPKCQGIAGYQLHVSGVISACIWMSTVAKNYNDSANDCKAKGAHLYTIKNREKMNILRKFNEAYWIGLDDIQEEKVFRWIDDGSILPTSLWKQYFNTGEPSDKTRSENCVHYYTMGAQYLNDAYCSNTIKYICEIDCFLLP